jgi:hypothetical protein
MYSHNWIPVNVLIIRKKILKNFQSPNYFKTRSKLDMLDARASYLMKIYSVNTAKVVAAGHDPISV